MRDDITDEQIERFWSHVEPFAGIDACWLWTGRDRPGSHNRYVGGDTYGEFRWTWNGYRHHIGAHRMAYSLLVGDAGETLDHLCRNTLCVNPDHLEPVSAVENIRRGNAGRKRAA